MSFVFLNVTLTKATSTLVLFSRASETSIRKMCCFWLSKSRERAFDMTPVSGSTVKLSLSMTAKCSWPGVQLQSWLQSQSVALTVNIDVPSGTSSSTIAG